MDMQDEDVLRRMTAELTLSVVAEPGPMDSEAGENWNHEGRGSETAEPTVSEVDGTVYPDFNLWGNLQYYIPLVLIYTRLPTREFSQCRVVCKEWNLLAYHWNIVPGAWFLKKKFKWQWFDRPNFRDDEETEAWHPGGMLL